MSIESEIALQLELLVTTLATASTLSRATHLAVVKMEEAIMWLEYQAKWEGRPDGHRV